MSAILTVTVVYDDKPPKQKRGAPTTLRMATTALRYLRAVEKAATGKTARLPWTVNIYSLSDRAVIEFDTYGPPEELEHAVAKQVQQYLVDLYGMEPKVVK